MQKTAQFNVIQEEANEKERRKEGKLKMCIHNVLSVTCKPTYVSLCLHRASITFKHFIIQLMHNIQFVDTIKIIKIFKLALTCFGSQRIHHQGALYSAWLKL